MLICEHCACDYIQVITQTSKFRHTGLPGKIKTIISLLSSFDDSLIKERLTIIGSRRQANLCFHFAGSRENLPDIAKSRDTSMDNKKQNSFLF